MIYDLCALVVFAPCWYLFASNRAFNSEVWARRVKSICPYIVMCCRYKAVTVATGAAIQWCSWYLVVCFTDIAGLRREPSVIMSVVGIAFGLYLFKTFFERAIGDWYRLNQPILDA